MSLRHPIFIAILAACLLGLSGCAQMTVKVGILNSAYWSSPAYIGDYIDGDTLAKIVGIAQTIRDGRFIGQREELKKRVETTLNQLATTPNAVVALADVPRHTTKFGESIDKEFGLAQSKFEAAFAKVREAFRAANEQARNALVKQADTLFAEGAGALSKLVSDLSADIRTVFRLAAEQPPPAALQTFDKEAEGIIREGLIGQAGILDDPRAAAVVYAPEQYWSRQFNQTFCSGWFGNTDCAVKMEGLGSFTIKGVRLDAAKITQATFSVAREAIQTVAAVYGVPVPKSGAAAGTPPAAGGVSVDLESPVKRQREATTSLLMLRLARLSIFETIVAQRKGITSTDENTRRRAVATINAVFEANRKQLDALVKP